MGVSAASAKVSDTWLSSCGVAMTQEGPQIRACEEILDITFDPTSGLIYFLESTTAAGILLGAAVAGSTPQSVFPLANSLQGPAGIGTDSFGNVWFFADNVLGRATFGQSGPSVVDSVTVSSSISAITFDFAGNGFIAVSTGIHQIFPVIGAGILEESAWAPLPSGFTNVKDMVFGDGGALYVLGTEGRNDTVIALTQDGADTISWLTPGATKLVANSDGTVFTLGTVEGKPMLFQLNRGQELVSHELTPGANYTGGSLVLDGEDRIVATFLHPSAEDVIGGVVLRGGEAFFGETITVGVDSTDLALDRDGALYVSHSGALGAGSIQRFGTEVTGVTSTYWALGQNSSISFAVLDTTTTTTKTVTSPVAGLRLTMTVPANAFAVPATITLVPQLASNGPRVLMTARATATGQAITDFAEPLKFSLIAAANVQPSLSSDGLEWMSLVELENAEQLAELGAGYQQLTSAVGDTYYDFYTYHFTSFGFRAQQSALTVTPASNAGTVGGTIATTISGGTTDGDITYAVPTTTNVCSINSSGVITGLAAGTCTITAEMAGNATYAEVIDDVSVTFSAASDSGDSGSSGGTVVAGLMTKGQPVITGAFNPGATITCAAPSYSEAVTEYTIWFEVAGKIVGKVVGKSSTASLALTTDMLGSSVGCWVSAASAAGTNTIGTATTKVTAAPVVPVVTPVVKKCAASTLIWGNRGSVLSASGTTRVETAVAAENCTGTVVITSYLPSKLKNTLKAASATRLRFIAALVKKTDPTLVVKTQTKVASARTCPTKATGGCVVITRAG